MKREHKVNEQSGKEMEGKENVSEKRKGKGAMWVYEKGREREQNEKKGKGKRKDSFRQTLPDLYIYTEYILLKVYIC